MDPLDIVTLGNAAIAGLALALRGNMLKPEAKGWASSRTASLVVLALSIFMGGYAIDVWKSGGASEREVAISAAVALSSVFMLVHLWMQRRTPGGDC